MHRISQSLDGVVDAGSVVAAGTEAAAFDPNDLEDPRLGEISGEFLLLEVFLPL